MTSYKKIVFILGLATFSLLLCSFSGKKEYGVFLGLRDEEAEILNRYDIIVVEGEEFSSETIRALHKQNKKIFAYLNVGSLETYRSYYKKYKKLTLGVYENWKDERWVDVSKKEWQDFIVKIQALKYKQKGFDGFFIDNTDVYYQYKKEKIYLALASILAELKKYDMKIIINGGDYFVLRLMAEGRLELFDGINQECVFTSIDFNTDTYKKQNLEAKNYFLEYLEKIKNTGKEVYLLEYGANIEIRGEIEEYCKKNGFRYFISKDKELKDGMF